MINVTKSYLPKIEEYQKYISEIWERNWLTNNGPLVVELEKQLISKLDIPFLQFVSNGTIAIQIALKALDVTGEVITTPYSYVATTTSIMWENSTPVFCDISLDNFGIDPDKIEPLINKNTRAILATHVYGIPCDVERIEAIAKKYGLVVIYDAAHAFGVKLNGMSILNFGDVSTLSFHSTKIFHSIEGGGIVVNNAELNEKIFLLKSFGHRGDNYYLPGINGKNSEFHAAMGLCVLKDFDKIKLSRKSASDRYKSLLDKNIVSYPEIPDNVEYNYSYFPVFFKDEKHLLFAIELLNKHDIFPRRYFYPSLNNLPYLKTKMSCPISENLASRVLCLPLYCDINHEDIIKISRLINSL